MNSCFLCGGSEHSPDCIYHDRTDALVWSSKIKAEYRRVLNEYLSGQVAIRAWAKKAVEALEQTSWLAEKWAEGVGRSHPDHDITANAHAVLAEAKKLGLADG